MASWLKRTEAGIHPAPITAAPTLGSTLIPAQTNARFRDPNAPDIRLDIESTCVYERQLPGNAYITAHVTRLQDGFYDSPSTHGDAIDNVRFLSVYFVFHPSESINRFQSATVSIALHDDTNQSYTDPLPPSHRLSAQGPPVPRRKPKFLRYAPHVIYGSVSPETLDWNFNLTGSLGVSQTPVTASLAPSGGVTSSYKVYQMMRIQGSTRTARSRIFRDPCYDIEDGEVVWTMEENPLQRSGLPREMTFVMLITKGDVENVVFDINIEPKVAAWFGHYPKFWTNLLKYQPLQKEHVDLDKEIGQRFEPTVPGRGFNFADLASSFNDFVSLPGAIYSVNEPGFAGRMTAPDETYHQQQNPASAKVQGTGSQRPPSQQRLVSQQQPIQPSTTAASILPQPYNQQSQISQDEPMDYHIFLHNPRSINLHATPPPPSNSAPPAPQKINLHNPLNATDPILRPRIPIPDRTRSPANTKMKRRSIDISYMSHNLLSPSQSQSGLASAPRKVSPGSLRRSRSRTDLRSSPVIEDSHSDGSQISSSSSSRKESISAPLPPESSQAPNIPSPPQSPDDILVPMQAPSPPGSTNMRSPPLPSWKGAGSVPKDNKLPFELNKPTRPPPLRQNSNGSGRMSRTRGSSSPMRASREITPSPNEEVIDMNVPPRISLEDSGAAKQRALRAVKNPTNREREISPYATAALANGVGLKGGGDENWDEAKGDLKALRARKRYSVPAHYSYIHAEEDADRDWEER